MPTGNRDDPYRGFNFRIELDDATVASFSECSGLTFDTDPVEYREGTDIPLHVRKLTGLRKFANIALKRGFTDNTELWDWYNKILNGIHHHRIEYFQKPDRVRTRNGGSDKQHARQTQDTSEEDSANGTGRLRRLGLS